MLTNKAAGFPAGRGQTGGEQRGANSRKEYRKGGREAPEGDSSSAFRADAGDDTGQDFGAYMRARISLIRSSDM